MGFQGERSLLALYIAFQCSSSHKHGAFVNGKNTSTSQLYTLFARSDGSHVTVAQGTNPRQPELFCKSIIITSVTES